MDARIVRRGRLHPVPVIPPGCGVSCTRTAAEVKHRPGSAHLFAPRADRARRDQSRRAIRARWILALSVENQQPACQAQCPHDFLATASSCVNTDPTSDLRPVCDSIASSPDRSPSTVLTGPKPRFVGSLLVSGCAQYSRVAVKKAPFSARLRSGKVRRRRPFGPAFRRRGSSHVVALARPRAGPANTFDGGIPERVVPSFGDRPDRARSDAVTSVR